MRDTMSWYRQELFPTAHSRSQGADTGGEQSHGTSVQDMLRLARASVPKPPNPPSRYRGAAVQGHPPPSRTHYALHPRHDDASAKRHGGDTFDIADVYDEVYSDDGGNYPDDDADNDGNNGNNNNYDDYDDDDYDNNNEDSDNGDDNSDDDNDNDSDGDGDNDNDDDGNGNDNDNNDGGGNEHDQQDDHLISAVPVVPTPAARGVSATSRGIPASRGAPPSRDVPAPRSVPTARSAPATRAAHAALARALPTALQAPRRQAAYVPTNLDVEEEEEDSSDPSEIILDEDIPDDVDERDYYEIDERTDEEAMAQYTDTDNDDNDIQRMHAILDSCMMY